VVADPGVVDVMLVFQAFIIQTFYRAWSFPPISKEGLGN
jgi:hypothetical protein